MYYLNIFFLKKKLSKKNIRKIFLNNTDIIQIYFFKNINIILNIFKVKYQKIFEYILKIRF